MTDDDRAAAGHVMIEGVGGREPWPGPAVLFLIAIPLIAIFTALATWWSVDHIEDQLEAEARDDLAAGGIPVADEYELDFDYRDGDAWIALPEGVSGREAEALVDHRLLRDFDIHQRGTLTADGPAGSDTAIADDEGTEDVVTLVGTDVEARLVDGVITLTGAVPSEAHREELVAAAASVVGVENVVDQLMVADGASTDGSDGRVAALAGAIAAAGVGDDLTFSLTDTSLDIEGSIAEDRASAMRDAAAAAALDGSVDLTTRSLGSTEVDAVYDGETITLTGTVLSEAHRQELLDAAAGVVGAANVVDELVVLDAGALVDGSDASVSELAAGIGSFADGGSGVATLADESVDVTVNDALAGDDAIDELQTELDGLAAEIRENVVFATGSDLLDAGATATLDKVADAMTRHPLPVVEIVGHTDSTGNADANRTLSGARAQAVVDYLISQGIDAARLQSRGAGADEPIADNGTADGRAQNRRVELTAAAEFVG